MVLSPYWNTRSLGCVSLPVQRCVHNNGRPVTLLNLTRFHCGCCQHAACRLLCAALASGFGYLQSSCVESLSAAAWHWVLFLVVTWGWSVAETEKLSQVQSWVAAQNCGDVNESVVLLVMETRSITWNEMKSLSLFRKLLYNRKTVQLVCPRLSFATLDRLHLCWGMRCANETHFIQRDRMTG